MRSSLFAGLVLVTVAIAAGCSSSSSDTSTGGNDNDESHGGDAAGSNASEGPGGSGASDPSTGGDGFGSSNGGTAGSDGGAPLPPAGTLTSGAWDDNLNYDFFTSFATKVGSSAGAPPDYQLMMLSLASRRARRVGPASVQISSLTRAAVGGALALPVT